MATPDVSNYGKILWAVCVWREARGEPDDAKLGVAYSVWNRASKPGWWGGPSIASVVLKPMQYSSFNAHDPNAAKLPQEDDPTWLASLTAVEHVLAGADDPSGGATSYYDRSLDDNPPRWAASMTHTVDLGAFHFFKTS